MVTLHGVRLKLDRAREHRKAVDRPIGERRKGQLYPDWDETDPKTGAQR